MDIKIDDAVLETMKHKLENALPLLFGIFMFWAAMSFYKGETVEPM